MPQSRTSTKHATICSAGEASSPAQATPRKPQEVGFQHWTRSVRSCQASSAAHLQSVCNVCWHQDEGAQCRKPGQPHVYPHAKWYKVLGGHRKKARHYEHANKREGPGVEKPAWRAAGAGQRGTEWCNVQNV